MTPFEYQIRSMDFINKSMRKEKLKEWLDKGLISKTEYWKEMMRLNNGQYCEGCDAVMGPNHNCYGCSVCGTADKEPLGGEIH